LEVGKVEEKYTWDGEILKKGQAILHLSNTDFELSLANHETPVFNVLTQMQIPKTTQIKIRSIDKTKWLK